MLVEGLWMQNLDLWKVDAHSFSVFSCKELKHKIWWKTLNLDEIAHLSEFCSGDSHWWLQTVSNVSAMETPDGGSMYNVSLLPAVNAFSEIQPDVYKIQLWTMPNSKYKWSGCSNKECLMIRSCSSLYIPVYVVYNFGTCCPFFIFFFLRNHGLLFFLPWIRSKISNVIWIHSVEKGKFS